MTLHYSVRKYKARFCININTNGAYIFGHIGIYQLQTTAKIRTNDSSRAIAVNCVSSTSTRTCSCFQGRDASITKCDACLVRNLSTFEEQGSAPVLLYKGLGTLYCRQTKTSMFRAYAEVPRACRMTQSTGHTHTYPRPWV